MINDEYSTAKGNLTLSLEDASGASMAKAESAFEVPALGQQTYALDLRLPDRTGDFLLKAVAQSGGKTPTIRRRRVSLVQGESK
jgi:hypothetical protein